MATITSPIRSRERVYSDLDLGFTINPNTGDVARKFDTNAIKQAVRMIIQTRKGEKPFEPNFGCNLHNMLFENFDSVVRLAMISTIENALENYEPRIELINVDVRDYSDRNAVKIDVEYRIKSPEGETDSVAITVERLR